MELLTDGMRYVVDREAALAVFARHLALTREGRVEAAEIEVKQPFRAALHLLLGAQPIALLEPQRSVAADGDGDGDGKGSTAQLTLTEYFPDLEAL